jgi:hypothetical protein
MSGGRIEVRTVDWTQMMGDGCKGEDKLEGGRGAMRLRYRVGWWKRPRGVHKYNIGSSC